MSSNKIVKDGTEYRDSELRLREDGIKEILRGLQNGGFCSSGPGRLRKVDDKLFMSFCFNVGTFETKILALGVDITIPLTEAEANFTILDYPKQTETKNETTSDPVVPIIP